VFEKDQVNQQETRILVSTTKGCEAVFSGLQKLLELERKSKFNFLIFSL